MKKNTIYGIMILTILGLSGCGESENTVSENMVDATVSVEITEEENNMEEENGEEENIIPIESISNCLYIANMCGKDIESLSITFNAGSLQSTEILGEENLSDGELFTYVIEDMNSLRTAESLSLSINAVAADETVLVFPEVSIMDPSQMTMVLSVEEEGYYMYVK